MLQVARETNAKALTAHPNPIEASNFRKMIGYNTPPKLLPVAATPVAKPRFVEKYRGMTPTEGMKTQQAPRPTQNPCSSRKFQYCVPRLVIIVPNTTRKVPVAIKVRKYPISYNGPVITPTKRRRKTSREPIQEMAEGLLFGNRAS
jgi:hypothetical protein